MTLFQDPPASGCANGMCWIQWWWTVTQKVSLKVSSCQQFKSSVFIQFTMMEGHFLMHLLTLMFNRLGQFLRPVLFCLAFSKGWGAFSYTSVNTSVAQFHFSEGSFTPWGLGLPFQVLICVHQIGNILWALYSSQPAVWSWLRHSCLLTSKYAHVSHFHFLWAQYVFLASYQLVHFSFTIHQPSGSAWETLIYTISKI